MLIKCHPRRSPDRGTTVFQDLAALAGKRAATGPRRTPEGIWTPRAIDLMADALATPAQWWEYHRADVEAAMARVVKDCMAGRYD